jgi:GNAT superfamily N-acetyltransferase
MLPDPVLRLATADDIPAIQSLISASVRGLSVGVYSPAEIEESLVSVFGVDSQLLEDGTYFVIDCGGEIAASGGWSKRATLYGGDQTKRGSDPLLDPGTDAARIRAFYVAPHWARRGFARLLYQACERAALSAGFRRFQLGATLPGVPLYEALGFHALDRADYPMRFGLTLGIVRMERQITETHTEA